VLIHEIVWHDRAFGGFPDETQILRGGEAQAVSIIVDKLFRANAGHLTELGRGQVVCA